jgi:hypothetical protein
MSDVYHVLANGNFSQDWNDPNLITTDDNWSGVPSIIGYRGDNLVATTGIDPTTVRGSDTTVDVNANRSDPSTYTTGGVAEFQGTDGVVALQGSGTADAPHLVIHLDATGRQDLTFSTRLRDIDTSSTATQPIAVQYRVGDTGEWSNVPGGFVSNANTGGDTNLSVTLPAAVNGQAKVQVRVITTDAVGSDNFIGIDDIVVASAPIAANDIFLSIADASSAEGNSGETELSFTVTREGSATGAVSASWTVDFPASANANDLVAPLSGTVQFAANQTVGDHHRQGEGRHRLRGERDLPGHALEPNRRRHPGRTPKPPAQSKTTMPNPRSAACSSTKSTMTMSATMSARRSRSQPRPAPI